MIDTSRRRRRRRMHKKRRRISLKQKKNAHADGGLGFTARGPLSLTKFSARGLRRCWRKHDPSTPIALDYCARERKGRERLTAVASHAFNTCDIRIVLCVECQQRGKQQLKKKTLYCTFHGGTRWLSCRPRGPKATPSHTRVSSHTRAVS